MQKLQMIVVLCGTFLTIAIFASQSERPLQRQDGNREIGVSEKNSCLQPITVNRATAEKGICPYCIAAQKAIVAYHSREELKIERERAKLRIRYGGEFVCGNGFSVFNTEMGRPFTSIKRFLKNECRVLHRC